MPSQRWSAFSREICSVRIQQGCIGRGLVCLPLRPRQGKAQKRRPRPCGFLEQHLRGHSCAGVRDHRNRMIHIKGPAAGKVSGGMGKGFPEDLPFLIPYRSRKEGWAASFDWIISSYDNSVKVLEGKYDDRNGSSGPEGHGCPKKFRRENRRKAGRAWIRRRKSSPIRGKPLSIRTKTLPRNVFMTGMA